MNSSNSEKEMAWINAWNDLYELLESSNNGSLLLPGYREVSVEDAKGWIQDTVYSGCQIKFVVDYYKGKKSIFIHGLDADIYDK